MIDPNVIFTDNAHVFYCQWSFITLWTTVHQEGVHISNLINNNLFVIAIDSVQVSEVKMVILVSKLGDPER